MVVAAIGVEPKHLGTDAAGLLFCQRFDKHPHFFGGGGFD
jgi:hypothetical protein